MTFPREIESELLLNLSNRRTLFILGARQTGKTTLMKRIQHQVKNEKTIYFDLEKQDSILLFKQGIDYFIRYLNDIGFSDSERVIVFIDEIQYLEEFSSFIKLAVDHYSHRIKLVVSGSSAAQIKYQFRDSLVGRKFIFHLHPLSFREFTVFKKETRISELLSSNYEEANTESIRTGFGEQIKELYQEFIRFGGYPEVVLTDAHSGKKRILEEIMQAYILKDIRNLFTIEKIDAFNHLVRLLALQSGKLFNMGSVSGEVKLNLRTLDRYIQVLTDTYIIRPVKPLFRNKKKELKKMPKIFFHDTGLRNSLMNNYEPINQRTDSGELLESAVFAALWKSLGLLDKLYFWRTTGGKEIDFVLQKGADYIPFEVKIMPGKQNHLNFFSDLYSCKTANMVYLKETHKTLSENITLIPAWLL